VGEVRVNPGQPLVLIAAGFFHRGVDSADKFVDTISDSRRAAKEE
jgi:hypothetical protein